MQTEPKIEPIKKSRLSEEVLKRLQSMILDGTFSTGDQLPSERELAEQFQVSRASIREALRVLETLGFLYSKVGVGGGTFVQKVSIEALLNPFSEILGNEKQVIIEMLEFRKLLETEIARLAAERHTDDDLINIEKSLNEMRSDIAAGGIGVAGDTAFHDALATACHNSVFENMLSMAKGLLVKTRQTTLQIDGQPEKSLSDHIEIFNAIKDRDMVLSEELMLNHILKAQKNALENLR
ncbi:MAG TPA: hypothetical protein DCO79_16890 [Spirochaeta sp.]|nr:hypothetical protein [Spirochaeta sp.]